MTENEKTNLLIIELWVLCQRQIEILDDLDLKNNPMKNNKLKQNLKGIYPMLDKMVKNYDEIYKATKDGTNAFYFTLKENTDAIMHHDLIDKNFVAKCLLAKEKDLKAIEGILTKILK